jgi:hypothetical protein
VTSPLSDADLARTISDLDGLVVEPGAYGTGRTAWLARALVSPIGHLGPAEWRLLMQHEYGLRWVLPLVVRRLATEPFTPIDGEPAALLQACLTLPVERWAEHPVELRTLQTQLRELPVAPHLVAEPTRSQLAADIVLFLGLLDAPDTRQ